MHESYCPTYFSVEDILASQERIPCKFEAEVYGLGKLFIRLCLRNHISNFYKRKVTNFTCFCAVIRHHQGFSDPTTENA